MAKVLILDPQVTQLKFQFNIAVMMLFMCLWKYKRFKKGPPLLPGTGMRSKVILTYGAVVRRHNYIHSVRIKLVNSRNVRVPVSS